MDNYLANLFEEHLLILKKEILSFKDEENIWRNAPGVTNTAGTLVLHLVGNLKYTLGTIIGGTGYVRNREQEFLLTGVSREELVADIESTIEIVKSNLTGITPARLEETYKLEMFGVKSTAYYVTRFYGHFNYHLGQVNYLRRILEG